MFKRVNEISNAGGRLSLNIWLIFVPTFKHDLGDNELRQDVASERFAKRIPSVLISLNPIKASCAC